MSKTKSRPFFTTLHSCTTQHRSKPSTKLHFQISILDVPSRLSYSIKPQKHRHCGLRCGSVENPGSLFYINGMANASRNKLGLWT